MTGLCRRGTIPALRGVPAGNLGEVAATLGPDSVAPLEAQVHRALLRVDSMDAADLATRLAVPIADVRLCLKALEAKGFVSRLPGARGEWRAIGDELPSPDDMRLLALLLDGYTDEAIAARLDVGARTVQRRIHDLIELAGVRTRLQLVWFATRRGWL